MAQPGRIFPTITVINNGCTFVSNFQKITDPELNAVIPVVNNVGSEIQGPHHNYSRLMFDPDSADHLYVSRHWPAGGVFRIKLVSDRTTLDPANCIVRVEEVIKARYTGDNNPGVYTENNNVASEVINLLVTSTHVYAGVTCGHLDKAGDNYAGGLIAWKKVADPGTRLSYMWIIGGPNSLPQHDHTVRTMSIGGLAQDPANPDTILAVTYRFGLRGANGSRLQGEDNYKLMNLWQVVRLDKASQDDTFRVDRLLNDVTAHKWPDAVTMTFIPGMKDTLIMPTHGNGIWIGARSSTQKPNSETEIGADALPGKFALYPNHPNPFNSRTQIRFDLPVNTQVTLTIYDLLGRQIRVLVDMQKEAGQYRIEWDGRNQYQTPVSSGIYFCRMKAGGFTRVHKAILLR